MVKAIAYSLSQICDVYFVAKKIIKIKKLVFGLLAILMLIAVRKNNNDRSIGNELRS